MAEENKAIARRYFEFINERDLDALDDVVATELSVREGMQVQGLEQLKQKAREVLGAIRDASFSVEDVISEGDKVVARVTFRGTHTGELEGLPPTGRTLDYSEVFIFRISDGKIAELWEVFDQLTMLRQLGLMPEGEGGPEGSAE